MANETFTLPCRFSVVGEATTKPSSMSPSANKRIRNGLGAMKKFWPSTVSTRSLKSAEKPSVPPPLPSVPVALISVLELPNSRSSPLPVPWKVRLLGFAPQTSFTRGVNGLSATRVSRFRSRKKETLAEVGENVVPLIWPFEVTTA